MYTHYRTDPRLAEMLSKLKNFSTSDKNYLGRAEFKNLIMDNIVLISRSVSRKTQLLLKCFRKKNIFLTMWLQGSETPADNTGLQRVHKHNWAPIWAVESCGGGKNTELHSPACQVCELHLNVFIVSMYAEEILPSSDWVCAVWTARGSPEATLMKGSLCSPSASRSYMR